ncbi:SDR family NAD(P)-dependent oxidoreductase [Granulicella sibirica]|uniref:3-oxoacyl-[acyl-carrier protein] reductase n=1 Tax=Granulicella sibirica TaxID=2479048 RepID=A0A4Q0T0D9_9BACT|nr:SDR family oxidoreductase [Granulicella sibirica]RXH57053.1 3-oxoacyl-[acyl-carrier protein] reductase [Granulicella sibirica]
MNRFEGKVVIVTGAGSGIGAATAKRFLAEGAAVVLNGRRKDKLAETANGIDARRVLLHDGDISDEAYVTKLVEDTVEKFGCIDVLVNNAGVAAFGPILKSTTEQWHKVMSIDVDGVYFAIRSALPHLLKTKGSIVNVSSVSGLGGDWGGSIYNAAKGAVTNLTRALALELGSEGVRVNAVNPSLTSTEMTADFENNEPLIAKFKDRLPIGRGAKPEEVAGVIAFLASEDAAFVNGVNLPVDGGITASNGQPNMTGLV